MTTYLSEASSLCRCAKALARWCRVPSRAADHRTHAHSSTGVHGPGETQKAHVCLAPSANADGDTWPGCPSTHRKRCHARLEDQLPEHLVAHVKELIIVEAALRNPLPKLPSASLLASRGTWATLVPCASLCSSQRGPGFCMLASA
eukprot:scaffold436_cov267-Pinguiococcus_pyrenoidosus.AAC.6